MSFVSPNITNIFTVLKSSPLNSPIGIPKFDDVNEVPSFSLLQENPKYIEKKDTTNEKIQWADIHD